jgi:hypothetical protein
VCEETRTRGRTFESVVERGAKRTAKILLKLLQFPEGQDGALELLLLHDRSNIIIAVLLGPLNEVGVRPVLEQRWEI